MEQDHTFANLCDWRIKWFLWLENKLYNFKNISFLGFKTVELVPKNIECSLFMGEDDVLILNYTDKIKYHDREYSLENFSWDSLINQIIGFKLMGEGVIPVYWSRGDIIYSPSYIQEKSIFTEQIKSFFSKLSLDSTQIQQFEEVSCEIELTKSIGGVNFSRLLIKRLFTRYKSGRWVMSISFNKKKSIVVKPEKKNCIWADPFILQKSGENYLLYEEMEENAKGKIAYGRLEENDLKPLGEILKGDTHFSYPFVFWHDERLFLIPENAESNAVHLYELNKDTFVIETKTLLMKDVELYDPTLLYHDDIWYLFANKRIGGLNSFNDDLHIYYSDELISSHWKEHPKNPVVRDVRSSRPAGAIFKKDNELIRPSQNNAYYYGYGMVFNRIVELSTKNYKEEYIEELRPKVGYNGLHTYNSIDNIVVTDLLLN